MGLWQALRLAEQGDDEGLGKPKEGPFPTARLALSVASFNAAATPKISIGRRKSFVDRRLYVTLPDSFRGTSGAGGTLPCPV